MGSYENESDEFRKGMDRAISIINTHLTEDHGSMAMRQFLLNVSRFKGSISCADELSKDVIARAKSDGRYYFDKLTGTSFVYVPNQWHRGEKQCV